MPGDGLTHGPPATKNAGGSHHRFGRYNRRIQSVVATLQIGTTPIVTKHAPTETAHRAKPRGWRLTRATFSEFADDED